MKLILLPGLDGTGALFKPLIQALNSNLSVETISYPPSEQLSYLDLVDYVANLLPSGEDFYLVAESFSGPIGLAIASDLARANQPNRLKGVVFIASFASPPSLLAKYLAPLIPARLISPNWIPNFIVKKLMLGATGKVSTDQFWQAVQEVDAPVLKQRILAIRQIELNLQQVIKLPCCYIQANQDWLVPAKNIIHFQQLCPNLTTYRIDGPHFIAQANPTAISNLIISFINSNSNF
jgi:pimeloyl-ACP methyl ester carboxylesterase